MSIRSATLPILCVTALLASSGCATYREQPVDLATWDAAWRGRDPFAEPVSAFARRLTARGATVPLRIDPADGLDLAEAEVVALVFNPSLHAARLRAGIADADARTAGRWDDPAFRFDALRAVESVAKPWTLLGGLSLSLPLSGRLGLEHGHAGRLAAAGQLEVAAQEWALLTVLRDTWVAWSAAREQHALAASFANEAEALAGIGERLHQAGELSVLAARAIRIAALRAGQRSSELDANAQAQELALRALLGLAPDAPVTLRPALTLPADLRARVDAPAATTDDPALRTRLARHQAAEARLRLEIRKQYPDLNLGLSAESDRGERSFGPSLGFSIPLWNGNVRGIANADAERSAVAAELEAAWAAAVHDRTQAQVVLADRALRLDQLDRTLVPLVDAQLADAKRLAGLGDLDAALLLDVLDTAWQCKSELVALRAGQAQAENRLIALALPGWLTSTDEKQTGPTAEGAAGAEGKKP